MQQEEKDPVNMIASSKVFWDEKRHLEDAYLRNGFDLASANQETCRDQQTSSRNHGGNYSYGHSDHGGIEGSWINSKI
ncbi:uncharacterized protein [Elaeis guineensis]|uniref:uncharacterized protein n=1 Tax=Elaeis guineensis var. tenera TaxID=51953 RepID=UPI00095030CD